MSSARQTVMRGPSLIGRGYRPSRTPAHQVDLLTGIGPAGARIDCSRSSPVARGSVDVIVTSRIVQEDATAD